MCVDIYIYGMYVTFCVFNGEANGSSQTLKLIFVRVSVFPVVTYFTPSCIIADKHLMSLTLSTRACVRCMSTSVREKRRKAILDRIIRVDHAGEFGALRIYEGQMAVLGRSPVGPLLKARPEETLACLTPPCFSLYFMGYITN